MLALPGAGTQAFPYFLCRGSWAPCGWCAACLVHCGACPQALPCRCAGLLRASPCVLRIPGDSGRTPSLSWSHLLTAVEMPPAVTQLLSKEAWKVRPRQCPGSAGSGGSGAGAGAETGHLDRPGARALAAWLPTGHSCFRNTIPGWILSVKTQDAVTFSL